MVLGIFKNKIKEERRIGNAASRLYFWIGGQERSYLEEIKKGMVKESVMQLSGRRAFQAEKKKKK